MHLIGFVISGQHIHDNVDTGAVGVNALHRIVGDRRVEWRSFGIRRPGACKIIAGYHDGRDTVSCPHRPVGAGLGQSEACTHRGLPR